MSCPAHVGHELMYTAVLVEDNIPNGNQYSESLRRAGFDVVWYTNASDARANLSEEADTLVDLFVLDREIPDVAGDTESVDTGDVLFEEIQARWADSPILVFTAHSTPQHTQNAISNRGQLWLGPTSNVDRVQIAYKEQGSRFLEQVRQVAEALDLLQDVHVLPDTEYGNSDRGRALRRLFAKLAARNSCGAIRVRRLGGGRSGDEVFECELLDENGIIVAAFVGKTRKPGWVPAHGAMYGLPQAIVAPHVDLVSGMAAGTVLELFQIVSGATPLDELLKSGDPDAPIAIDALSSTIIAHGGVVTRLVGIEELVEPLVTLDFLQEQLAEMGVAGPRTSLSILSERSLQHGDLHGGNVLVKDQHPALIDFGKRATASRLLDPVTLMLSMWLHPDGMWFTSTTASDEPVAAIRAIIDRAPDELSNESLRAVARWVVAIEPDPRELWSICLGYAVRQLWYETAQNEAAAERIAAIANAACTAIGTGR